MSHKIAFYLYAVTDSGVTKILMEIASGLSNSGYNVLFIYSRSTTPLFLNQLDSNVKIINLNQNNRLLAAKYLNKTITQQKPDVLITGGSDNNCVAVASKLIPQSKHKVIITEHTDLSSILKHSQKPLKRVLPYVMQVFYPRADVIAAVSKGVAKNLSQHIDLDINKIKVLYNPVVSDKLIKLSYQIVEHPWLSQKDTPLILSVGRLSTQKDYFNLINAFYKLRKQKDANLLILGEGQDRFQLQELIDSLDLTSHVQLFGLVDNPYAYMRKADLFALSSKWEGLPTVLIEALACNTPVVSTDCPHGPREILEDGKWGKLVPIEDSEALAKAMLDTINSPRQDVSQRAEEFTHEKSIARYIEVIENLTNKG